jgi:hypothetical protein
MSAGLQGAIETAPVTRLHERRSYDPADFGVPSGREEEWRFTPLRRLRGLHTDAPPVPTAGVTVDVDPVARELPMEYALELNRLIELQMEGAVG